MDRRRGWSSTMRKVAGAGAILGVLGGGYLLVRLGFGDEQNGPPTATFPQASGNPVNVGMHPQPQVTSVGYGQEQDVITLIPLDALVEREGQVTHSGPALVPFETEGPPSPPEVSEERTAVPPRIPLAQD